MVLHLSWGNFFAFYIEFNISFGAKPILSKEYCKGETIVNFPYGQIIYTPARVLAAKTEKIYVAGTAALHTPLTGTPENR